MLGEAIIQGKFDGGFDPELSFTIRRCYVDVRARFFAREKEKTIRRFTKDSRTHAQMLPRPIAPARVKPSATELKCDAHRYTTR